MTGVSHKNRHCVAYSYFINVWNIFDDSDVHSVPLSAYYTAYAYFTLSIIRLFGSNQTVLQAIWIKT